MHKITILFTFCFILLKINFYGQDNGFVKGEIKDKNGDLPGVVISIDSKTGTTSDINGHFLLKAPAGTYTLDCSMIGYKNQKQTITIVAGDTLKLNFKLSDANTMLEEVVVSAGKFEQKLSDVTVSMDVIKPQIIENKNTTSLDIIMNQVSGVTVNDGQASIRGGSGFAYGAGSRVLMMVDEMPMISADAGDVKWNYLPLENLEQVEVIKGASSALFGSSALNGVINLRTAYAKDIPATSVTMFASVYDAPKYQYKWWSGSSQQQQGINVSHSQKIGNLDFVFGGHIFDDGGYRGGIVSQTVGVGTNTVAEHVLKHENENRTRFNINLRYNFKKITGLSIGVNTNFMDVKGGLFFLWKNADSAYVPNDIQAYKNRRCNIDPFITYYFGDGNKLSYRNRYFITINTNDKNQEATSVLRYNDLQYQKKFKNNFTITTGLVYMTTQIYSDSLYGRHTGKNYAGYLQLDKKVKKLTMSLGLRAERYEVDTAYTRGYLKLGKKEIKNLPVQPVFRAGVNYQLFDYTFIRASYGQGYRFPSVAEKFISTNVGSLKIYPNQSLQPERGWSAELGIKQGFKISKFNGFIDVAGFWTEYVNMVEFVFDFYVPDDKKPPSGQPLPLFDALKYAGFKSRNLGRAQIKGVEVTLSGTGKIGPIGVSVFSGYTFIDPINPDYNPTKDTLGLPYLNVLKYRNRHLFKNDIQFDYKFLSIGYSVRYQSFMENIDRKFTESILHDVDPNFDLIPSTYVLPGLKEYREKNRPGSWVHDVRISFQISKWVKLSYIVSNLFNEEYSSRPGDVRPPRMQTVQLKVNVNYKTKKQTP
ncbi:MAG TPA: TonB-dependent receptor [Bacteroidia bacterium]|nr:TonB-dependent receptor [Bacteroidia bacterium]